MARTGQAGRRDGPDESRSFVLRVAGGRHLRGPGLPYVTTLTSHKEPSPGRLEEPLPRENPWALRCVPVCALWRVWAVEQAKGCSAPRSVLRGEQCFTMARDGTRMACTRQAPHYCNAKLIV